MIPLDKQEIDLFGLDKWNSDVVAIPIYKERAYKPWTELIEFFNINPGVYFMKLHHSPKDYSDGKVCSPDDVIRNMFYSDRLREDLLDDNAKYLFLQEWRDIDTQNIARVFIYNNTPFGVKWMVHNDRPDPDIELFRDIRPIQSRCCIDVEIDTKSLNRYQIIEYNPLDYDTDLYGLEL